MGRFQVFAPSMFSNLIPILQNRRRLPYFAQSTRFAPLKVWQTFQYFRVPLSVSQSCRSVWNPPPAPGIGLRRLFRRCSSSRLALCAGVAASSRSPALDFPLETRCFLPQQQCTCRLRRALATFGDAQGLPCILVDILISSIGLVTAVPFR